MVDKSHIVWNELHWHQIFHFVSLILCHTICRRPQESYPNTLKMLPCISLTFRRVLRSFRGNQSAKKVHLQTGQLRTKVSFSDNVPHRLYICSPEELSLCLFFSFFLFFNKWSSLYGVLSTSSMRNVVTSLTFISFMTEKSVWYFLTLI